MRELFRWICGARLSQAEGADTQRHQGWSIPGVFAEQKEAGVAGKERAMR